MTIYLAGETDAYQIGVIDGRRKSVRKTYPDTSRASEYLSKQMNHDVGCNSYHTRLCHRGRPMLDCFVVITSYATNMFRIHVPWIYNVEK